MKIYPKAKFPEVQIPSLLRKCFTCSFSGYTETKLENIIKDLRRRWKKGQVWSFAVTSSIFPAGSSCWGLWCSLTRAAAGDAEEQSNPTACLGGQWGGDLQMSQSGLAVDWHKWGKAPLPWDSLAWHRFLSIETGWAQSGKHQPHKGTDGRERFTWRPFCLIQQTWICFILKATSFSFVF